MRNLLKLISLAFIYTLFSFAAATADMTVELTGGVLNGVSVESGILELTLEPGAEITGNVSIETENTSSPSNVAPLVLVWNWDVHETSFATIDGWIPIGETGYDIPIILTLPDTGGLYFLTFAYALEKTGAQVASLTNWQVDGTAHWNDGVDIADWDENKYSQSVNDHFVTTFFELVGGFFDRDVPAAMVKIYAELPPQITGTSPGQNELDVARAADIFVVFNEAMEEISFNDTTFLVTGSCSGRYSGSFSYDDESHTVTFAADEAFGYGEIVTVLLTTGIKAAGGTPPEQSFSWSFTVAAASGGGNFVTSDTYPVSATPHGLYSANLDNDDDLDVVTIGRDGGLTVVFNNGDGTFSVDTTYEAGFHATHVTAADFNGDGLIDAANTEVNNSRVHVHINTGDGAFATAIEYDVGTYPGGICAADFNGDGHIDLASANNGTSNISVLTNLGDGTFATHTDYSAGSEAHGICCGDLDNDGDIDIVSGSWASSSISVSLNNGNGTFASGVGYAVESWPRCPVTADFNGDDYLDIAVANFSGNSISVLPGNGDGTFALQTAYSINFPHSVCQGDIDGDGDIDLIAPDYNNGWLKIFTNDGSGNFTPTDSVTTDEGRPFWTCAADYNGDGILDIASTDLVGSKLRIILNQLVTAVIDNPNAVPSDFNLRQNYPNPFNPETVIEYRLQLRAPVNVTVYNVLGQPVKTLIDETQPVGNYRTFWDGTDRDNRPVATGVYFYRLKAGDYLETKKMILLK
ncbi:MAG: FG-GAP-like repeat-containing protein [Candidatus Zixiibacteriota bacterium]